VTIICKARCLLRKSPKGGRTKSEGEGGNCDSSRNGESTAVGIVLAKKDSKTALTHREKCRERENELTVLTKKKLGERGKKG